jgi:hypothetical protein
MGPERLGTHRAGTESLESRWQQIPFCVKSVQFYNSDLIKHWKMFKKYDFSLYTCLAFAAGKCMVMAVGNSHGLAH